MHGPTTPMRPIGYAGADANPSARPDASQADQTLKRQASITAQLHEVASRVSRIHDNLFGARPQGIAEATDKLPPGGGFFTLLGEGQMTQEQALGFIGTELAEIEQRLGIR
jgi:hypothetical protein